MDGETLPDAALSYAGSNLAVFPLAPRGKQPAFRKCEDADGLTGDDLAAHAAGCPGDGHGLHDATTDIDKVQAWWQADPTRNIGIATGTASGIVVIDVDDPDSLDALEDEHGELPRTMVSHTYDGMHLVYQRPAEGLPNSTGKLAPGIDIRGDGGYIAAPPSAHPDGGYYRWRHDATGEDVTVAELPQWVADLLTSDDDTASASAGAPGEAAGDAWGRRALDGEISKLLTAPTGQRNDTLFRSACKVAEAVKGGHLEEADARDRLEGAASRILGLPIDEVRPTVQSAWDRTRPRDPLPRDTGNTADSTPASPGSTPAPAPQDTGMLTIDDLWELPPARWVVPQRVPEGMTILFGPTASGKTFVALDWTCYVAATQERPVVYCTGEGARGIRERLSAWMAQNPGMDPRANLRLRAMGDFPRLLDQRSIERFHVGLAGMDPTPVLVVIDTWARALAGGDENAYKDVARGIAELDKLQELYGSSVIVLAHTAFPPGGGKPTRPRGHGAIDGAADAMWRVEPPAPSDAEWWHRLRSTKLKDSAQPPPVDFYLGHVADSLAVHPPVRHQIQQPGDGKDEPL